mgnify:CR=1 FL=1
MLLMEHKKSYAMFFLLKHKKYEDIFCRLNDSYQNINASVAWKMGDWDVQLYGENIADNDDYTFILPEFSIPGRHGTLRPRTFGIRVSTSRQ